LRLEPDDIEAIAHRVAELLDRSDRPGAVRLVDAAEVARALSVDREWVYAHAQQLGALRLGGPQGRLRFDLNQVRQALAPPAPDACDAPRRPRSRSPRRTRWRGAPAGLELLAYES
jgi:hypothetical protein